jgi:hypothetical protein
MILKFNFYKIIVIINLRKMQGIKKIEAEREARRAKMEEIKIQKAERKQANELAGKGSIDVEFD